MALVAVAFFHASVIYLHRCRDSAFGSRPARKDIQEAMSELVRTAYQTVTSYAVQVQLLERFQWSLLIAGTETDDPVHREWFGANISDPALARLYTAVQDAKQSQGGCISMHSVRGLLVHGP
jgi:hypothetical protein